MELVLCAALLLTAPKSAFIVELWSMLFRCFTGPVWALQAQGFWEARIGWLLECSFSPFCPIGLLVVAGLAESLAAEHWEAASFQISLTIGCFLVRVGGDFLWRSLPAQHALGREPA